VRAVIQLLFIIAHHWRCAYPDEIPVFALSYNGSSQLLVMSDTNGGLYANILYFINHTYAWCVLLMGRMAVEVALSEHLLEVFNPAHRIAVLMVHRGDHELLPLVSQLI
jgi:hypothetical protein